MAGGNLERVQSDVRYRPSHHGALASVRAKLQSIAVQADGEGALEFSSVPANHFALPTSTNQVIAVRTKRGEDSLGFVTAQNARFTGLGVHAVKDSAVIG